MTRNITLEQYQSHIDNDDLFVLDFHASWCPKCVEMMPVVHQVAEKISPNIPVYTVDIDAQPELKEKARIKAIPMLTIINKGYMRDFVFGVAEEEKILTKIKRVSNM